MLSEEELLQFIEESQDHLETIEKDLMELEAGTQGEVVNRVFRAAHSIKGGASFFALHRIQHLAHRLESILDRLRSGETEVNPVLISTLLTGFDRLGELVNLGSSSEQTEINTAEEEVEALFQHLHPNSSEVTQASSQQTLSTVELTRLWTYAKDLGHTPLTPLWWCLAPLDFNPQSLESVGKVYLNNSTEQGLELLISSVLDAEMLSLMLGIASTQIVPITEPSQSIKTPQNTEQIQESAPTPTEQTHSAPGEKAEATVRIPVTILEALMNLAGELVLARNQMAEAVAQKDLDSIEGCTKRLSQVTTEIQEAVMRTRLQSLGTLFQKFPRVIRDLSKQLGKEVRLDVLGKEVEVDKTILEGLSDPLTHMIRNALDHGLETPGERISQGKDPEGVIRLEAKHEAGQVVIEIHDNGKGIDGERVVQSAIKKGLLSISQTANMTTNEKVRCIFLPGLSTAEAVTDLSGRGVGMDVVQSNIERLGGKIEIETKLGEGSIFRIRLPLTLVILPCLLTSVGDQRFALPQSQIEELLLLNPEAVSQRLRRIGDAEVLELRGEWLPLIDLGENLGIPRKWQDPHTGQWHLEKRSQRVDRRQTGDFDSQTNKDRSPNPGRRRFGNLAIAIVNAGTHQYGLVLDAMHDTLEIVVKPLESWAQQADAFAGATILGDGTVALILDVSALAQRGGIQHQRLNPGMQKETTLNEDSLSYIASSNQRGDKLALPLAQIQRIEKCTLKDLVDLNGHKHLPFRGRLMQVFEPEKLHLGTLNPHAEKAILVFEEDQIEWGILADQPLDVLELQSQDLELHHDLPWITHTFLFQSNIGLVIDPLQLTKAQTTPSQESN
jgi:two-component system chemotaxis sensor kinase CheA